MLHGTQRQFYRGSNQLWQEEHFENGIQIGLEKSWYHNGQLKKEGQCQQGKKQGAFKYYSENGTVVLAENYNMDIPIGIWTWFDENGNVKAKGVWRDGKKHGGTFIDISNPITGRVIVLTTFQEGNKVDSHQIELSNPWLWP